MITMIVMGRITIRFYSRGIPFPGSHCGANRPSLSYAVHSFRSCRGRRASFLWRKNSNKSISNLMETLATRPEGWTCSILKEPCVCSIVWTALERISSPALVTESSNIAVRLQAKVSSRKLLLIGVTFRSISAGDLLIYDFSVHNGAHNLHPELRNSSNSSNDQVPGNQPIRRQHVMCNHVHPILFACFFHTGQLCLG